MFFSDHLLVFHGHQTLLTMVFHSEPQEPRWFVQRFVCQAWVQLLKRMDGPRELQKAGTVAMAVVEDG